jgi:hypothetical protein
VCNPQPFEQVVFYLEKKDKVLDISNSDAAACEPTVMVHAHHTPIALRAMMYVYWHLIFTKRLFIKE